MLRLIICIWLLGGTILYISSMADDLDHGQNRIYRACKQRNIPYIVGELVSFIVTVIIGFPFFVYKMGSLFIGGVINGRSDITNERDDWDDDWSD